jgi:hypothetical protein
MYIVIAKPKDGKGHSHPGRFFEHPTYSSAVLEADRLAKATPKTDFQVAEIIAVAVPTVTVSFERPSLPF